MKRILLYVILLFSTHAVFSQSPTIVWKDNTCPTAPNGSVTITYPPGLIGDFEYTLIIKNAVFPELNFNSVPLTDVTSYTFTNLRDAGDYLAYASYNGMPSPASDSILHLINFTATTNSLKEAGCLNQAVGIIDVEIDGGISPYDFVWSNGQSTTDLTKDTIKGITKGTYDVTVTDAVGCVISSTSTTIDTLDVLLNNTINTHVICKGLSTGSVSAVATNGTGEYTYKWAYTSDLWSDEITGSDHNELPAEDYYVVATDEYDCDDTVFFSITEPATKVTLSEDSHIDLLCKDIHTGHIALSTLNAQAPLSYNWTDGETGATRSSLPANSYKVIVTDNDGCKDSLEIDITQPATHIAGSIDSSKEPLCNGDANGEGTISASGGTGSPTYLWDDAQPTSGNALRTDLTSRNYEIIFSDDNNCKDTLYLDLGEPDILTAKIVKPDDSAVPSSILCFGNTENVKVNVTGGTEPIASYDWDDVSLTDISTATLGEGSYNITITDDNGCTATDGYTITGPTLLDVTLSIIDPIECKGENGEVSSTPTGGTPPYYYSWSNGSTDPTTGKDIANNYELTVTDDNGCTVTKDIDLTEPANSIVGSIDASTEPLCNGDANGTANISATGGTAPYTFLWDDGEATSGDAARTDLDSKLYTITFTDDNGCTDELTLDLEQPDVFTASIDLMDNSPAPAFVNCFEDSINVKVNTAGGTLPVASYDWDDASLADIQLSRFGVGTFNVEVVDANGCIANTSHSFTEPSLLTNSVQITTPIVCKDSLGVVSSTIGGGTTPYNYAWSNGSTNPTTGLTAAGNQTLIVTDDRGCTAEATVLLDEPATHITGSIDASAEPLCNGDANGTATVSATGGTGTPIYLWDDAEATSNDAVRTDLDSKLYTITFTDDNGCSDELTLDLEQPDVFTASIVLTDDSAVPTELLCFEDSINVKIITTGGTLPVASYDWDDATLADIQTSRYGVGTFNVQVVDDNGCIANDVHTLTQPTLLTNTVQITTPIVCKDSLGIVSSTIGGGTPPYNYSWSNGSTNPTTGLTPTGNQTLTVTDDNGCIAIHAVLLDEPATHIAGSIDASTEPLCNGDANGTATVSATGGTGTPAYLWDDAEATSNNAVRTDLDSKLYTITFTDDNGCTDELTLDLDQPDVLTADILLLNDATVPSDLLCFEDSIDVKVVVAGGTEPMQSFTWNAPTLASNDTVRYGQGSYIVTATDANGCIATDNHDLAEPTLLVNTIEIKDTIYCKGDLGSLDAKPTGGTSPYYYSWSNGENIENTGQVVAGNYSLTLTDDNGCSFTENFELPEPATHIVGSIDASTMPLCYLDANGTATVSAVGGTGNPSYLWDDGKATSNDAIRTDLDSRFYTITFSDENNCTDELTLDLLQPDTLTAKILSLDNSEPPVDVLCFDDSIKVKVVVTGGTGPMQSYIWDDVNVPSLANVEFKAGSYSVEVTDANGCTAGDSHSFTEPPLLVNTVSIFNAIECNGLTGRLGSSPTGGVQPYLYNWSNGSTEWNTGQTISGDYSLTVTDAHGCMKTTEANLPEPDTIQTDIVIELNVCKDVTKGNLSVNAIGGTIASDYIYLWDNNVANDTIENLEKKSYKVSVTDDNGCMVQDSIDLTTINEFTVTVDMTEVLCLGDSSGSATAYAVYGNEPYTYDWSNGMTGQTISNIPEGIYTVTVTDKFGCTTIGNTTVTTKPAMYVQDFGTTETTCSGAIGSAYVDVASGAQPYQFLWSNGATIDSITDLVVGHYSVDIRDANGCKDSVSFYVTDTSSLTISVSSPDVKIRCANRADGEATVTPSKGTAPYEYNWSNGTDEQTATDLLAGTYYIEVVDDNGCSAVDSIQFFEEDVLTVSITDSTMVNCYDGNDGWTIVKAEGGIGSYSTLWSNGETTSLISGLTAGTYTATMTDENGCSVSDEVTITQPDEIVTSIDNIIDVKCGGECTGEARVLAIGGIQPFSYTWNNGDTDSVGNNLCGGLRYVDIIDQHGCTAKATVTIEDKNPVLGLDKFNIQPDCGLAEGEIAVTPFGGVKPYYYDWSNNGTDSLISNVLAGSYTLLVKDANNCELDTIFSLNDNSTITIDFTREASTFCSDSNEVYRAVAANGTAPYTYIWSNGDTGEYADSLTTKEYAVSVTDDNGCTFSDVVSVEVNHIEVELVGQTNVDCFADSTGTLEVIAKNSVGSSYVYAWDNDSTNADMENLKAGTYTVTVSEPQHGCTVTESYEITQIDEIQPFFITDEPSYCLDSSGVIHVEVIGGTSPYTYLWETGETSYILDSAWNEYIDITITDQNNCIMKDSAKVSDISNFTASEGSRYLISCLDDSDGALELALNNGYEPFTYTWSHDNTLNGPLAENLAKGTYSVIIVDNKDCEISYTFDELTNPDTMKFVFTEKEPIFCHAGEGILRANISGGHPGYEFSWTLNDEVFESTILDAENAPTGTYTVSAEDSRGCLSDTLEYFLNHPPLIQATFTVGVTGCGSQASTGTITVDTIIGDKPPYKFSWHDDPTNYIIYDGVTSITKTGIEAGAFEFRVYDTLDICHNEFTNYTNPIIVTEIDTLITPTHCNFYTVDEINSDTPNGSIEITKIITQERNYDDVSDNDSITDFTGYSFIWEDPNSQSEATAINLVENEYFVTVIGTNECETRFNAGIVDAQVNVESKIISAKDSLNDRISICLEDSVLVSGNTTIWYTSSYTPIDNDTIYTWTNSPVNKSAALSSNSGKSIWVNPITEYYTDSTYISMTYTHDGCSAPIDNMVIKHWDSLDFNIEVVDIFDNYVGEDSVFAIKNEYILINPTNEPWYVWKDEGEDGIASIAWTSLNENKDGQGQLNDTVTNEISYLSSDYYGLYIPVKEATYYYATATTTHGCTEKADIVANVYEHTFITNLITPNGDGNNDTWEIPYLFMCPDAKVFIYNRWGTKVWESEGEYFANPWDGRNSQGKELPMSTYYYLIEYNDKNDTEPSAGTITIMY
jgi:gliding motility-associated-like protein